MAVTLKDYHSKAKNIDIHAIRVSKGNRKGVTTLVEGYLHDGVETDQGSFSIAVTLKVNGKDRQMFIHKGDVVFKTGTNKRWQVLPLAAFKKRFPDVKL